MKELITVPSPCPHIGELLDWHEDLFLEQNAIALRVLQRLLRLVEEQRQLHVFDLFKTEGTN